MRQSRSPTLLCGIAIGVLAAASRSPAARGFRPSGHHRACFPASREWQSVGITIDDGASAQVVGAFADFCHDSGIRLRFSSTPPTVRGRSTPRRCGPWSIPVRCSWVTTPGRIRTSPASRPVPSPTRSAETPISCATPTVSTAPRTFVRPGANTARYRPHRRRPRLSHHHLWSSDIADSGRISEAGLIAAANRSFQPQQIVVGHANLHHHPLFRQLLDIIRSRNLQMVALNDVFT